MTRTCGSTTGDAVTSAGGAPRRSCGIGDRLDGPPRSAFRGRRPAHHRRTCNRFQVGARTSTRCPITPGAPSVVESTQRTGDPVQPQRRCTTRWPALPAASHTRLIRAMRSVGAQPAPGGCGCSHQRQPGAQLAKSAGEANTRSGQKRALQVVACSRGPCLRVGRPAMSTMPAPRNAPDTQWSTPTARRASARSRPRHPDTNTRGTAPNASISRHQPANRSRHTWAAAR